VTSEETYFSALLPILAFVNFLVGFLFLSSIELVSLISFIYFSK